MVYLDIEGAFNNIMPNVITVALTRLVVDRLNVGLINQLLKCRTQGGVLSHLLWNVAVNELMQIIEGEGCSVFAYADDIAIAFLGCIRQTLCDG